jgi:hypothetical protein
MSRARGDELRRLRSGTARPRRSTAGELAVEAQIQRVHAEYLETLLDSSVRPATSPVSGRLPDRSGCGGLGPAQAVERTFVRRARGRAGVRSALYSAGNRGQVGDGSASLGRYSCISASVRLRPVISHALSRQIAGSRLHNKVLVADCVTSVLPSGLNEKPGSPIRASPTGWRVATSTSRIGDSAGEPSLR